MSTPHNKANHGEIAKVVLMSGDPLRAKYIAEHYLTDVVCFNDVRNMFGYSGYYKGHYVSVMGSGMGMASIGIYSYELFKFYDVDVIIRIGSCGAYVDDLALFDLVLAKSAYSESSYAYAQSNCNDNIMYPSQKVNDVIKQNAMQLGYCCKELMIHSSDVFYHEEGICTPQMMAEKGCSVVEMESFALFHNANVLNKKAACLLTVSDSLITHQETTSLQREQAFHEMMILALESAIKL